MQTNVRTCVCNKCGNERHRGNQWRTSVKRKRVNARNAACVRKGCANQDVKASARSCVRGSTVRCGNKELIHCHKPSTCVCVVWTSVRGKPELRVCSVTSASTVTNENHQVSIHPRQCNSGARAGATTRCAEGTGAAQTSGGMWCACACGKP